MGFRFQRFAGFLLVVLLWGSIALADNGNDNAPNITVRMINSAQVSAANLLEAEEAAARILTSAGVEVAWRNCPNGSAIDDACAGPLSSGEFVVNIVPTGKTATDLIFGIAFLGEDGTGRYCDAFFDRIAGATPTLDPDTPHLLAAVVAHELGHLLLGSRSHARFGIMTAVWQRESLHQIAMGRLLFTREQSALIKARIEREDLLRVAASPSMGGLRRNSRMFTLSVSGRNPGNWDF